MQSDPGRILTVPAILAKLSICRATLWRLRNRDPSFPRPVVLGSRCIRWRERDIDAWVEANMERPHAA